MSATHTWANHAQGGIILRQNFDINFPNYGKLDFPSGPFGARPHSDLSMYCRTGTQESKYRKTCIQVF